MYENLRKLRESLGMTQQAFGASVGVSKTTYSNYELGIREPNSDFFSAIADKYNVTVDYLIGRCDNPHGLFKRDMPSEQLTAVEQAHIKKYRALDEHGKEAVDGILEIETKRMETAQQYISLEIAARDGKGGTVVIPKETYDAVIEEIEREDAENPDDYYTL